MYLLCESTQRLASGSPEPGAGADGYKMQNSVRGLGVVRHSHEDILSHIVLKAHKRSVKIVRLLVLPCFTGSFYDTLINVVHTTEKH